MIWLLANLRLIAIVIAILSCFWAGWRSHTIYDGYRLEKAENKTISNLQEGVVKIIDFNQDFSKVKFDAKDCAYQPISPSLLLLLR